MHLIKIIAIQAVNLAVLAALSIFALEAWWKIFLFGLTVILITSTLALRYRTSAVALTVGSLPIAWMAGLAVITGGNLLGFKIN